MADDDPRYEVEDETMKDILRSIAVVIDNAMKKACEDAEQDRKLGFGLFIFEFQGPAFFWISNAERGDMQKALREWMQREGGH